MTESICQAKGGLDCGHGPGCEDWTTVYVLDVPDWIGWYLDADDERDVVPIRHMLMQELRGITCITSNDPGGWYQELEKPYRTRIVLSAELSKE